MEILVRIRGFALNLYLRLLRIKTIWINCLFQRKTVYSVILSRFKIQLIILNVFCFVVRRCSRQEMPFVRVVSVRNFVAGY